MSLLLLRCYILHLLIFCVSLLFFALGFCFVSCFFLFVSSFLCPCRCLASLVLSCIATGFGSRMEGFLGDGGWVGGGRLNARSALCVSPPLAGWGMRACFGSRRKKAAEISRQAQQHRGWRKLAQEGKRIADFPGRQQRSRGTHSTEDGASWLKKEKELQISLAGSRDFVAGTAQRMAQVGSRRKKKCRFRGRHSKEAKDSKVLFYFWFLNGQAHSSYLSISAGWDFYRRWGVQSRKGQGSSPMCLPLSITLIKCNARVFVSTQGCRALNQANV